jgi:hypothetical protein
MILNLIKSYPFICNRQGGYNDFYQINAGIVYLIELCSDDNTRIEFFTVVELFDRNGLTLNEFVVSYSPNYAATLSLTTLDFYLQFGSISLSLTGRLFKGVATNINDFLSYLSNSFTATCLYFQSYSLGYRRVFATKDYKYSEPFYFSVSAINYNSYFIQFDSSILFFDTEIEFLKFMYDFKSSSYVSLRYGKLNGLVGSSLFDFYTYEQSFLTARYTSSTFCVYSCVDSPLNFSPIIKLLGGK